ncbi:MULTISPECIES: alpha/beta fold hydrolase [unclassified Pseudoclavibacter]|uniref:alpha/beta fold hydrolase n=1 Tax=unclassified Pseudoclavibacter TaxID=2615177 RepID=UPI0027DD4D07|nr:alpha/beta fold hydrolase [Pseudoclavibacter sp. Marseille-Q4354]
MSPASRPASASDLAGQHVQVRYIRHGEVRARVSTIGADGDRAFVLVAGIGVASNYYENLAPGLGEFGPVHALDLPGFAGVPYPKRPMSIQRYAAVVGTVVDELGLVDPVLIGHSMGTQVVAELASQRPELSTLVLIGPVTNPRERSLLKLAFRFLESSAHEPFRVAMLAVGAYLLCGFRWFSAVLPRMMRYRIEDVLPHIQAHTLIIRGEHDSLVPRSWLREMAGLLPRASTWEIEGAAHSVMYDHAKGVAELCVDHAREPFDTRSAEGAGQDLAADAAAGKLVQVADEEARNRRVHVTPRLVLQVLRSRWNEFFASADNRPQDIAEAKTEHFQAQLEAFGAAEADAAEADPNGGSQSEGRQSQDHA